MFLVTVNSFFNLSQTDKDSLELIKKSITCLEQNYSKGDSNLPLAIVRQNKLDYLNLIANGINFLTTTELFNLGYCIYYQINSISISAEIAELKFFNEDACDKTFEKEIILLTFYKSNNEWIISKCD